MPLSRKRKKKGKKVSNSAVRRAQRLESVAAEQPSGVTLQDLINMVAYQEYQEAGIIDGPAIPDNAEVEDDSETPYDGIVAVGPEFVVEDNDTKVEEEIDS